MMIGAPSSPFKHEATVHKLSRRGTQPAGLTATTAF